VASALRHYLDTSAYLAVLLGEPGSELIQRETSGSRILSSVLLVLEARRTLVRLAREGSLSASGLTAILARIETDLDAFIFRELTLDLCVIKPIPLVVTPRSLDLAHLRTAAWFHETESITRFVSLDRSQNAAARELGLPV
jgi:hypothetical protein